MMFEQGAERTPLPPTTPILPICAVSFLPLVPDAREVEVPLEPDFSETPAPRLPPMTLRAMLATAVLASGLLLLVATSCVGPAVGLEGGALRACPGSPNCVSSEAAPGDASRVEPLLIPAGVAPEMAFESLAAVLEARATIEAREPRYLHAVFKTRVLRFRDDFEARLDVDAGVIQVRSASRLGYSDLGANRRRVEAIRVAFQAAMN